MDAKVTALLLAEGLDSMEDFEKELSSIRSKLDNAIRGNHDLLLPQLLKKLDRRENLKRKIDGDLRHLLLTVSAIDVRPHID